MERLRRLLTQIDGRGYKAYKKLQGEYRYADFDFIIDHVQGDPFADPSRCRIKIAPACLPLAPTLYEKKIRRIACEDYLGRHFASAIKRLVKGSRGSGKSGQISIARYGQQVLERNAVLVGGHGVEVRFQLALPASGRTIDGKQAQVMLFEELPAVVEEGLLAVREAMAELQAFVDSVDDQAYLREQLSALGLVGFIGNGAILPRLSGIDDHPMPWGVPFSAPPSLQVELKRQHALPVTGMGIRQGVTLIVGGGFHGKSTLLRALELGVYNHVPEDGRELVVTDAAAYKVRAEDGRAISGVDITPFINNLPQAKSTDSFNTQNASGSTSQAASIIEALAAGSRTLLIDEDTSATNFMIRDKRMQALVSRDKEPITPLVRRIRGLYRELGVSVVMVMGGSGDFFSCADQVIMLDNYLPNDVTNRAHELAAPLDGEGEVFLPFHLNATRVAHHRSFDPLDQRGKEKVQVFGLDTLRFGEQEVDVSRVEQLVDRGQMQSIGYLMKACGELLEAHPQDLVEALKVVLAEAERNGLDQITPYTMGTLAMPRLQELAAAVNRLRSLELVE